MQVIIGTEPNSIARTLGVKPKDALLSINDQPVLDVVDYEYLTAQKKLTLLFAGHDGGEYEAEVEKDEAEPLGLCFESGLMSPVRTCRNHCLFCFIDQMPKPASRDTLRFKDDDWRMSLIMGNYITLTNVNDAELARIIERRVSPLYISVHATDPDLRVRLMRNKSAGNIRDALLRLYDANLRFHCQIVCCPGLNDGEALKNTLNDLFALYPAAQSVAVVPVGLTKHREGLYPLRPFTRAEAESTLLLLDEFSATCKKKCGSAFAFASDELVLLSGRPLPPYEAYEDFPQLENGVGLLRLFESEFLLALEDAPPVRPVRFDAAGGMLAAPFFEELYGRLHPYQVEYTLHPIENDYFGHGVTVGGLITGRDLCAQLKNRVRSGRLLLPGEMLREGEDVFLDGMSVEALAKALGVRVYPVRGGGEAWAQMIYELSLTEDET